MTTTRPGRADVSGAHQSAEARLARSVAPASPVATPRAPRRRSPRSRSIRRDRAFALRGLRAAAARPPRRALRRAPRRRSRARRRFAPRHRPGRARSNRGPERRRGRRRCSGRSSKLRRFRPSAVLHLPQERLSRSGAACARRRRALAPAARGRALSLVARRTRPRSRSPAPLARSLAWRSAEAPRRGRPRAARLDRRPRRADEPPRSALRSTGGSSAPSPVFPGALRPGLCTNAKSFLDGELDTAIAIVDGRLVPRALARRRGDS